MAKIATRKKQEPDLVSSMGGKIPPQDLDAEKYVISAMLVVPDVVEETLNELVEECFLDPKLRIIFNAIRTLFAEHIPLDIITLSNKLKASEELETIGGIIYLTNLSQNVATAANIEHHVKSLQEKYIQRELIKASLDILSNAYDQNVKVSDLLDIAQTKVYSAVEKTVKHDVRDLGMVLEEVFGEISKKAEQDNGSGLTGVPSGFATLDATTLGWQPSDLIILGARPSVGKTAFSLNLATNAAIRANVPTAFFSLEMAAKQVGTRILVAETNIPSEKLKKGNLTEDEWANIHKTMTRLSTVPIYIDDTPQLPVMEFRSKLKKLVQKKGVRLVIVDYLQLMLGPTELRGFREQEVAAVSRTLKATAKELNVSIIALAQLSRLSVQRGGSNNRPQLSDLRESGSIEQDADMVMFLHRPEAIGLVIEPGSEGYSELIIAKHRNGEIKDIPLQFIGSQVRFVEAESLLGNNGGNGSAQASAQKDYNPFREVNSDVENVDEAMSYNSEF